MTFHSLLLKIKSHQITVMMISALADEQILGMFGQKDVKVPSLVRAAPVQSSCTLKTRKPLQDLSRACNERHENSDSELGTQPFLRHAQHSQRLVEHSNNGISCPSQQPPPAMEPPALPALRTALEGSADPETNSTSPWASYCRSSNASPCGAEGLDAHQYTADWPLDAQHATNAAVDTVSGCPASSWRNHMDQPVNKQQFKVPTLKGGGKVPRRETADGLNDVLRFPSLGEDSLRQRLQEIRDTYASPAEYQSDCLRAVEEEIGLRQALSHLPKGSSLSPGC